MDTSNNFEDSFSDDDDAEFIALTARPRIENTQDNQIIISSIAPEQRRAQIQLTTDYNKINNNNIYNQNAGNDTSLETQQDRSSRGRSNSPRTPSTMPSNNSETAKHNLVDLNNKFLEAVGEIAVLRSKLKEMDASKSQQMRNLVKNHHSYSKEKEEKLTNLQQQITKLEEEKQFYIAELKNPYLKSSNAGRTNPFQANNNVRNNNISDPVQKKRKSSTTADDLASKQANVSFASAKQHLKDQPRDEDIEMIDNDGSDSSKKSAPLIVQRRVVQKTHNHAVNYKSLFLESIWNHTLMGSSRKTIDILSTICITFDYGYKSVKIDKYKDPISTALVSYLVNTDDNLRIDDMISEFVDILIDFLEELVTKNQVLATPLLLALLHNSLVFRTNAVTKNAVKAVLQFTVSAIDKFFLLLDTSAVVNNGASNKSLLSQSEEFLETRVFENTQTMVLQSFDLIFLLDILEALCKVAASFDDAAFVEEIWTTIIPVDLIRFCLSSSCPINCIVSMVESMLSSVTDTFAVNLSGDKRYDLTKKFCDKELVKLLLSLFTNEIEPKSHVFVYGLNRIIGNNTRIKLLDEIYPSSESVASISKSPRNLLSVAFPLSQASERKLREINFAEQKRHEHHVFHLKLSAMQLMENYLAIDGFEEVSYFNSPECVKTLVEEMGAQQDMIMRKPRSDSIPTRVKVISATIMLLAPLLLEDSPNEEYYLSSLISRISAGVKRQMIVALTRIAFSTTLATGSATELLNEARGKLKYDGFLFNEFCEKRIRELCGIQNIDDANKATLIQAESGFPNGVEYGFGDDIIGLSRDILEICITPDEADSLYYAFIPEDPDAEL